MTLTKIAPQNLRTPGPTPIPDDIVSEMSLPMINHRGPEFKELIEATTAGLKQVFMTANDLYILTASGTGALESAVVNTLSPGDRVMRGIRRGRPDGRFRRDRPGGRCRRAVPRRGGRFAGVGASASVSVAPWRAVPRRGGGCDGRRRRGRFGPGGRGARF